MNRQGAKIAKGNRRVWEYECMVPQPLSTLPALLSSYFSAPSASPW